MKVIEVRNPAALETLTIAEHEQSQPRFGEVCVRIRASSLNFHYYAVAAGMLPVENGRIPMSDGAGEVVSVGPGGRGFVCRR